MYTKAHVFADVFEMFTRNSSVPSANPKGGAAGGVAGSSKGHDTDGVSVQGRKPGVAAGSN